MKKDQKFEENKDTEKGGRHLGLHDREMYIRRRKMSINKQNMK